MSNEKTQAAAPAKEKAKRMVLNDSDKQYIVEGLKTVKNSAAGVEKTMFFDPNKVVARIDELIAFYSK